MDKQCTVIAVETQTPISANMVEYLHTQGFSLQVAKGFHELFNLLSSERDPILLFDFGKGPAAQSDLSKLLRLTALGDYPIVVLGERVRRRESELAEVFQNVITLDQPVVLPELIGAIDYLARARSLNRVPAEPNAKDEAAVNSTIQKARAESAALVVTVPQLCFEQMESLGLKFDPKEIQSYIRKQGSVPLAEQPFAPEDPEVLKIAETICEEVGPKIAAHLNRSAETSAAILAKLEIPPELLNSAKGAAYLYAMMLTEDPDLMICDYLGESKADARQKIAQHIMDAGEKLAGEMSRSTEAEIVKRMGDIVGERHLLDESPIDMVASMLMAIDLMGRLTWRSGFWEPRSVNYFLRKIRSADVPDIHPQVLGSIVTFLSYAIGRHAQQFCLSKMVGQTQAEQFMAGSPVHSAAIEVTEGEKPLHELRPGMRVSQPVKTVAGLTIIETGAVLDEDLIWRLWQLAAVCPLSSREMPPIPVIQRETEPQRAAPSRRRSGRYSSASSDPQS